MTDVLGTGLGSLALALALLAPRVGAQGAAPLGAASPVDFASDVLPILSDKCFLCHGPDASSRKAGLRLDLGEEAHASGVLSGGDDADFLYRIREEDPSVRMPPPEAKHELSSAERSVLEQWVKSGAEYAPHWAFVALPDSVDVPDTGGTGAVSPIDRFVARHWSEHGLVPAQKATRERWLRRVTFDLTGLPPTPEDIRAFVSDDEPGGKERVVDRLLASPDFGERMATPWLDVARYADSYGYQSDLLAPHWPYRDWVVRALNENMPYDDFLVRQLAGDKLPEATDDDRLATAFNRLHRMTNEGGSVEEEWRDAAVVDRVETLGSSVLGLTLGCARCHDHKFDPVSQKEFYGLYAYFNSIDEWGLYHDTSRVPTPSLLLPTEAQRAHTERLEALVERCELVLKRAAGDEQDAMQLMRFGGLRDKQDPPPTTGPFVTADLTFNELVSGDGESRWRSESAVGADAFGPAKVELADGRGVDDAASVVLDGDRSIRIPDAGSFGPTDAFSIALWLWLPKNTSDGVLLHRSGGTDVGTFGFDLVLRNARIQARHVRFWPGNAVAVESSTPLKQGQWNHIVFVQRGTAKANGMWLTINGQPGERTIRDVLTKLPGTNDSGLEIGARFRGRGLAGARIDDVFVWQRELTGYEVKRVHNPKYAPFAGNSIRMEDITLRGKHDVERGGDWRLAVENLRESTLALLKERTRHIEVSVMAETLVTRRRTYVLERGEYDAPKLASNEVERGVPVAMVGEHHVAPVSRLELGYWITSRDHPLTARVAVNRLWQVFFDEGLVATPADFGLQGATPTHPELLDWLARSFIESEWDVKALCREIVLSATYGRDSRATAQQRAADPENLWLARGPSQRLTSEMLRDTALFASGLLAADMGGPPVSPYQPPGLWRENNSMSPGYKQSIGEGLYRRSLYSVVKRTAPLPNMTTFDAPMRETSCARREQTSTPLQGLTLLNDVQFVEAARALAERALTEHEGDVGDAVESAFVRLAGRGPDLRERQVLVELYGVEVAAFEADEHAAKALIGAGTSEAGADVDPAALAAMTTVVQTLMNLDAVVWKR